ncbi:MAG TPA: metallophosphoesterase family protein [Verrucomicrobiae bacterium]
MFAATFRAAALLFCFGVLATSIVADDLAPSPQKTAHSTIGKSYAEWVAACKTLPSNRQLRGRFPAKDVLPLKQFAEFDLVLAAFLQHSRTHSLAQSNAWLGTMPDSRFFDTSRAYFQKTSTGPTFKPFAQKLNVPSGSQVFFHGDFHGDVQSFITALEWLNEQKYLSGFKIVRDDFYMVFLGDYTDRGAFGVEVLYTLMRLKLANPDRVYMSRGNHEDISLLTRYGFFHEGRAKYGNTFDIAKIARAYDFLPVVIYLESGANALQCNHGGMEPGYDPRALLATTNSLRFQLLGTLTQKDFLSRNPKWPGDKIGRDLANRAFQNHAPEDPVTPTVLGFMWNDFTVLSTDTQFSLDPDRAFIFGQQATRSVLENASTTNRTVQAVFRAHQHSGILNPMMRRLVASSGLFRHWQPTDSADRLNAAPQELSQHLERSESRAIPHGSVWTFNVGPDSVYGEGCGFTFDTFGLLNTAEKFPDWRIRVVNTQPRR